MLCTLHACIKHAQHGNASGVRPTGSLTLQEHGAHLHPHQVEAVNDLRQRWAQGESLLLADDCGLGKSTSFIAFTSSLRYMTWLCVWIASLKSHLT